MQVVGILSDETDPMVSVMKVEKAPQESYADVGGLEQQIQVPGDLGGGLFRRESGGVTGCWDEVQGVP